MRVCGCLVWVSGWAGGWSGRAPSIHGGCGVGWGLHLVAVVLFAFLFCGSMWCPHGWTGVGVVAVHSPTEPLELPLFLPPEPPRFIKEPRDQIGVSGGVASFVCQATGDPKPRVTWNKKGKKVNSQRFEVSRGAGGQPQTSTPQTGTGTEPWTGSQPRSPGWVSLAGYPVQPEPFSLLSLPCEPLPALRELLWSATSVLCVFRQGPALSESSHNSTTRRRKCASLGTHTCTRTFPHQCLHAHVTLHAHATLCLCVLALVSAFAPNPHTPALLPHTQDYWGDHCPPRAQPHPHLVLSPPLVADDRV